MTSAVGLEFLGRDSELHQVDGALAVLTRAAGPAAVIVSGEPGIGKTVLLRAVAGRASGLRVVPMSGFEPARGIPLGAASEMFQILRTTSEGAVLASVLRPDATETGPLEPLRVFEATRAALFALSPALVTFDDVQWADESSIALCHYLLRAAAIDRVPVGFAFATRPGPHLPQLVRAVKESTTTVVEMSLGPLERHAGVQLARRLDPGLTPDDADRLYDVSAGSPFWIHALVRRAMPTQRGHGMDAITQQLDSLAGDAAECLAAVVVAARPIAPADLAELLDWSHARVAAAAETLVDAGLVVTAGSNVRVAHDLIRETAYRQIPASEGRRLHRRVAEWLEQEAGDDLHLLTEALAHRVVVGATPLELALRIARSPQRRLLGVGGMAELAAVVDGSPLTDSNVAGLLVEIATLAGELGEKETAYERFAVLSDRLPTARGRARAALDAARQAMDLQRSADAAAMIARASALVNDDPWVAIEAAALENARRMWLDGDLSSGREEIVATVGEARALVAAEGGVEHLDADARRAYVEILSAAHDIALTGEDTPEMAIAAEERVAATLGLGEQHLVAAADAARMLWWSGRIQEAALKLTAVLGEARRQVYPALVADLCHFLAYNEYMLGRLTVAIRLLDEADQIEDRIGEATRRGVPWIRGGLRHVVEASTTDWQAAIHALQTAALSYTNPHARVRLRQWILPIASRFGGADAHELVQVEAAAALDDVNAAGCRRCYWAVVHDAAAALLRVGDVAGGAALLKRWDDAHPQSTWLQDGERQWTHALLVAATDPPAAVGELSAVVARLRSERLDLDAVWASIDLGRAQVTTGAGTQEAVETWSAALASAERLGAVSEAQLIRRMLRGVGARARARSAPPASRPLPGLTAREYDVVRLVAEGRRNAEIADTLFLSPKTVERHLSSIFTKLGVRSRAELISRYSNELRV